MVGLRLKAVVGLRLKARARVRTTGRQSLSRTRIFSNGVHIFITPCTRPYTCPHITATTQIWSMCLPASRSGGNRFARATHCRKCGHPVPSGQIYGPQVFGMTVFKTDYHLSIVLPTYLCTYLCTYLPTFVPNYRRIYLTIHLCMSIET